MSHIITIKSFPSGISLHIDPEADFGSVITEISTKFEESRKFFKNSKVALSIEDRIVSASEEKLIVSTIETHSDVEIICLVGKDELTNRKYVKALKRVQEQQEESNCRLYEGHVLEGEIIESDKNLVIIGDIMEGAACVCNNDLIVLGTIYGQAYAGNKGNKQARIIAACIEAEAIKIAGVKFSKAKVKSLFGKKNKKQFSVLKMNKKEEIELSLIEDMAFLDFYN